MSGRVSVCTWFKAEGAATRMIDDWFAVQLAFLFGVV